MHAGALPDTDDEQLRVLIVDDHAIVRLGLRALIDGQHGITVVDEVDTLAGAVFKVRRHTPDVVLLDVGLPDGDGIEAIARLRKEASGCGVLMLSIEDDPSRVRRAFANGASGYLLKDAAVGQLVAAVREVARGGRYLSPQLGARFLLSDFEQRTRLEQDELSDREREVLRLVAYGHTNQEVARRLCISVRTAEAHRSHIMRKLRLRSRAEMVAYALGNGMLERRATATA